MYHIEDNFYPFEIFNNILHIVKQYPINHVPEKYDGKRCSYGVARQNLTSESTLSSLILSNFPHIPQYKRKIEIANDVNGFWLKPHSDHSAKRKVTVIYLEGQKENGTTFHLPERNEKIYFVPNRAVMFKPDSKDTYDETSLKHSVEKIEITEVRRTIVVTYVDNSWNDIETCYDR